MFNVKKYERKADTLTYNEMGYTSDHYDVEIKSGIFDQSKDFKGIIFEVQVRTFCQHAWADLNHGLTYKKDGLTEDIKRRVFRLTSLFEIADDEFDSMNKFLLDLPTNEAAMILKTIEGKFYKFAKRPYNKELSLDNISNLVNIIPEDERSNKAKLIKDIKDFIESNEKYIQNIYSSNDIKPINFLGNQPEAILVSFLLEKYYYNVISEWENYYPIDDLNDISIAYGKPITIT